jgi:glycosyltransferase involved in cell wall biosynthesis
MDKKIRLLQVIPKLDVGGAETGCKDIAVFVADHNYYSSILCSGGKQIKTIDKNKVRIFKFPVDTKNPILIFLNIFVILFIIFFYKINIIHVRSRAPAWSCYFASKLSRVALISTFHGTYNFNNFLKNFYNSIMLKGNSVIAGSNFIFNHINKNYDVINKRIDIVPRGIDVNYFNLKNSNIESRLEVRKRWDIPLDNFLVLLPGRLTFWKGQFFFLNTLLFLKEQNLMNNISAVILGDDQGRSNYKNLLSQFISLHNLTKEVKMISHEQFMPSAYNACDLVVSASVEPEAFGRVAVEAQAMEKPILATNIGGSTETIIHGETGWLYEPNNEQALLKLISDISKMDKNFLKEMGVKGRRHVVKNYTVDQMCSKTLEIYKSLV